MKGPASAVAVGRRGDAAKHLNCQVYTKSHRYPSRFSSWNNILTQDGEIVRSVKEEFTAMMFSGFKESFRQTNLGIVTILPCSLRDVPEHAATPSPVGLWVRTHLCVSYHVHRRERFTDWILASAKLTICSSNVKFNMCWDFSLMKSLFCDPSQATPVYSHGWPLRNASIKKYMLTFLMYV